MKQSTIDRNNAVLKYAKTHTVTDTAKRFNITAGYVRTILKDAGQAPLKIPHPVAEKILQDPHTSELTVAELYEKYGQEVSQNTFRGILHRYRIDFKRVDKSALFKGREAYNRVKIDDEHLKANAHKYTCAQYYRLFLPTCSRATLYNRAKELGVSFINQEESKKAFREQRNEAYIIKKAKEEAKLGNLSKGEFYEAYNIKEYMSFISFSALTAREKITFNKARPGSFSAKEIAIIKEHYPQMGQKCLEYLPGRSYYSLRRYCYKHKIKYIGRNSKGGPGCICQDHLGNSYDSISKMCKHYGVTYSILRGRLDRGWGLEEALTVKSGDKRKNPPKRTRAASGVASPKPLNAAVAFRNKDVEKDLKNGLSEDKIGNKYRFSKVRIKEITEQSIETDAVIEKHKDEYALWEALHDLPVPYLIATKYYNALKRIGISTLASLKKCPIDRLKKSKGLGERGVTLIKKAGLIL